MAVAEWLVDDVVAVLESTLVDDNTMMKYKACKHTYHLEHPSSEADGGLSRQCD